MAHYNHSQPSSWSFLLLSSTHSPPPPPLSPSLTLPSSLSLPFPISSSSLNIFPNTSTTLPSPRGPPEEAAVSRGDALPESRQTTTPNTGAFISIHFLHVPIARYVLVDAHTNAHSALPPSYRQYMRSCSNSCSRYPYLQRRHLSNKKSLTGRENPRLHAQHFIQRTPTPTRLRSRYFTRKSSCSYLKYLEALSLEKLQLTPSSSASLSLNLSMLTATPERYNSAAILFGNPAIRSRDVNNIIN